MTTLKFLDVIFLAATACTGVTEPESAPDDGGGGGGSGSAEPHVYVEFPHESCLRIRQRLSECASSNDFHRLGDPAIYDNCLADCFEAATCEDVLASACNLNAVNDLSSCRTECSATAYFVCDGTREVPEDALCDGFDDCSDFTDEDLCVQVTPLRCPDGTIYSDAYCCDGVNSCTTLPSPDEEGCTCLQ